MPKKLLADIGLETKLDALTHQTTLARLIARQDTPSGHLLEIAACSLDSPCCRDGCLVCGHRLRKRLVKKARKLGLDKGVWTRANLILEGHQFAPGYLHDVDLVRLTNAVKKRLERSPFRDAIIVAGWDISWNTFENEPQGWNLHLYLLINLPCSEALKRQIADAFRLSSAAMRPKSIRAVKNGAVNFLKALTYLHKASFNWRSGYFEKRLKKDGAPRKNAKDLPLKPDQQIELLFWLSNYSVGARLIMRNLKRLTPPGAKMRLTPLVPIILPVPD